MSLPSSPAPSHRNEVSQDETPEAPLSVSDETEVTDVMDRKDLPDYGVPESVRQADETPRKPPNRPSTFTRLLLDKRQG